MSLRTRITKTEHAGPKNGGGYWGKRWFAKWVSRKARRVKDKHASQETSSEK